MRWTWSSPPLAEAEAGVMNGGIHLGIELVLLSRFEADAVLDAVESSHATVLPGVPTMFAALLEAQRARPRDLSSLRWAMTAAAPMPPGLMGAIEDEFGCAVRDGWGLSEAGPIATVNTPSHHRTGSVGRPLWGVEVAVDSSGGSPDGVGELLIRGHGIMAGYYGDEAATKAAITRDGPGPPQRPWLHQRSAARRHDGRRLRSGPAGGRARPLVPPHADPGRSHSP